MSSMFDAMGALSSSYNESPEKASRPFDKERDGFVIAGGAGMLVVEELDHASERNADIMLKLLDMEQLLMEMIWSIHPEKEQLIAC